MHPGRSSGRSLAERAAESGIQPAPSAGPPSGTEGRHCWVHSPPGAPGTWPGLLVEWRQRDGAWEGRVAFTVTSPEGPTLVEAWLPAARLQPR
jgi:hypothetical protein